MTEELQGLLNRIKEEGISRVQSESEQMLKQAKAEAEEILAKARKEAEGIIGNAEAEASQFEQRGNEALRQASRDLLISVRAVLTKELEAAVNLEVKASLQQNTIAGIIDKMINMFEKQQGDIDGIEVLLSTEDLNNLESFITKKFSARLKNGILLKPSNSIDAGIQIGAKGNSLFIDFTDESLTEMLCEYLNPRLSKLVQESIKK